jgi:hypothetical protein
LKGVTNLDKGAGGELFRELGGVARIDDDLVLAEDELAHEADARGAGAAEDEDFGARHDFGRRCL